MTILSKEALLGRVCTAIESSGWSAIILNREHPFRINAARETDITRQLLVYIWNVTSGGPTGVRPVGEYRIQLTGVSPPLRIEPNCQTLLLGWYEALGVFAGYDVGHHVTFSVRSPSIQVREGTLEQAIQHGLAFQSRGNNEVVAAFAPDQFMNYVLQQHPLHRFRRPPEVEILQTASTGSEPPLEDVEVIVPRERQETVRTVIEWSRRRDFRIRILNVYGHRCSVCQIQLGLVEAAHIIPVGAPGSNDLTCNGLALCPLHHDAYDDALVGVRGDYHIVANDSRLHDLNRVNLADGEQLLRSLVCNTILLPRRLIDRPNPDYLREGMRLRGWPSNQII